MQKININSVYLFIFGFVSDLITYRLDIVRLKNPLSTCEDQTCLTSESGVSMQKNQFIFQDQLWLFEIWHQTVHPLMKTWIKGDDIYLHIYFVILLCTKYYFATNPLVCRPEFADGMFWSYQQHLTRHIETDMVSDKTKKTIN